MARGTTVNIDRLADAVGQTLEEYRGLTVTALQNAVFDATKFCVDTIKKNAKTAFKGTGNYARSWKGKKQQAKDGRVSTVVYSDTRDNQASWLENGHAKVNGGRVEGRAHIAPAADETADYLSKRLEEEMERA